MIALSVLRAHLHEPPTADNALIRQYEQAAVARMERETGRYFGAPVARTEYREATGQREIWLAETPTGTVSVTSDGTVVPAADFTLRERRLRHTSRWGAPWTPADLVVSYEAGYTASGTAEEASVAAPDDIREAVLDLVTLYYVERIPVSATAGVTEMPHRVQAVINSWRRIVA